MAKATSTYETRTVQKMMTVEERVPMITLTLTADEADTLRAIGFRTAGDPTHSPRKHVEAIANALDDAGVRSPSHFIRDVDHPVDLVDEDYTCGGIRFLNYPTDGAA